MAIACREGISPRHHHNLTFYKAGEAHHHHYNPVHFMVKFTSKLAKYQELQKGLERGGARNVPTPPQAAFGAQRGVLRGGGPFGA